MRILFLPTWATIAVDILAWLAIHFGVSYLTTQMAGQWFRPDGPLFRLRSWEDGGHVYQRWLWVRRWKHRLPDAAPWFPGGIPKRHLSARSPEAVALLRRETCRGEWAHWVTILFAPLFLLWNPPVAALINMLYALAGNLPCIVVQRFNRGRMAGGHVAL